MDKVLFDIFPHKKSPAHVGVQRSNHSKLWNFNTTVQQVDNWNRYAFPLVTACVIELRD